jgi:hypothetical protein
VFREHEEAGSIPAVPIDETKVRTLGGATEARRSDKAKTVVRLHPERLLVLFSETRIVIRLHRKKRSHDRSRGRGVTAAQQTFNLRGVGSNPSGPILEMRTGSRC